MSHAITVLSSPPNDELHIRLSPRTMAERPDQPPLESIPIPTPTPNYDSSPFKFACRFCPRRFLRQDHLKRHAQTHGQEKLVKCGYCDKTFGRK